MSITIPQDPSSAIGLINDFLMSTTASAFDDHVLAQIKAAAGSVSVVDRSCKLVEAIYANKDAKMPKEAKLLAAGLAQFCSDNAWHGLAEEGRGLKISKALQREAGETGSWPKKADDPAPKTEYQKPEDGVDTTPAPAPTTGT